MNEDRKRIKRVVLAIVGVLVGVLLIAQCAASSDGRCSDDSRGATRVQAAAFSASKSGGTILSKPVPKPKSNSNSNSGRGGGGGGGFFSIFIIHDNDCD
ncbi:hypothetical protein ACQEU8_35880 [Streptomyces sp. CA-250714]|uniref:hypothetical protein n=1 Tax=Streptomyces sp. CA-250714 TaxID=3240060 RepID=UPI003D93F1C5